MKKQLGILACSSLLVGGAALVGCGASDEPVTEPGATGSARQGEIPGRHDPDDLDPLTAQAWVDNVEFGRSVDPSGKIDSGTDEFTLEDRVYLSMEVTDAPAGSPILVSIVESASGRELWNATRVVEAGKSHLVFEIDPDQLGSGDYRAEVYVGDERIARRTFDILERHT